MPLKCLLGGKIGCWLWKVGAIQTLLHFYNVYFNIKIFWKWPKKIWGQKEGHGLTLYIQYHYLHGSYNQIKCWSLILMPGCWIHQHPQFHFSVSFFAGKPRITYNLRFEFQLPHSILETGHQNLRQLNCSFTTISSQFFGIYLPKNWGPDGHFEVLNISISELVHSSFP